MKADSEKKSDGDGSSSDGRGLEGCRDGGGEGDIGVVVLVREEGAGSVVTEARAEIGAIGGSGFYEFLEDTETVEIETPFGAPPRRHDPAVGGRTVAFIPRHGVDHRFPPHKVPYRANLWALKDLGVTRVFGPCAVGSLQDPATDASICDQAIDFTKSRDNTFYDGPQTTHVSFADPYAPRSGRRSSRPRSRRRSNTATSARWS